jgi:hypothetical protein
MFVYIESDLFNYNGIYYHLNSNDFTVINNNIQEEYLNDDSCNWMNVLKNRKNNENFIYENSNIKSILTEFNDKNPTSWCNNDGDKVMIKT